MHMHAGLCDHYWVSVAAVGGARLQRRAYISGVQPTLSCVKWAVVDLCPERGAESISTDKMRAAL